MFSALFRKEWRQLATLRWAGIALGAAMPALAAAGAEFGRRGWLPWGPARGWTAQEIFVELSPAIVAFGVWPLMALMFTAQTFVGDRATGTESFLLERPVGRGRVWLARLAAVISSTLALAAATGVVAIGVAEAATGGAGIPAGTIAKSSFVAGAVMCVLICSGLVAAAFLRSPVGALLLGIVLAIVPAGLATFLGGAFPFAAFGHFPVGFLVPWILLPGYVAASWTAATRGEPAGRGSVVRAARATGVAAVAAAALFVSAAPVQTRLSARGWDEFVASPDGETVAFGAFLLAPLRMVNTETGEVLRRLPPPVYHGAWRDDGDLLAVTTSSGWLGSDRDRWRVEWLSPDGSEAFPPIPGVIDTRVSEVCWIRDRFVVLVIEKGGGPKSSRILSAAPGAADWTDARFPNDGSAIGLLHHSDSELLIASWKKGGTETELIRLAWSGTDAVVVWRHNVPHATFVRENAVSPDGRYVTLYASIAVDGPNRGERALTVRPLIVDTHSGESRLLEGRAKWVEWLRNDRVAWVVRGRDEEALFVGSTDGDARMLRAWSGGRIRIASSPDDSKLLVHVLPWAGDDPMPEYAADSFEPPSWEEGHAPVIRGPEVWLVDFDSGDWSPLEAWPPPDAIQSSAWSIRWAGPNRLARLGPDAVAFESLDRPGEYVWARGGPR